MRILIGAILSSGMLVTGCTSGSAGTAPADAAPDAAVMPRIPPSEAVVLEVRFLGVGGFSFRVGGDQILTGPLYTNPSLNDVLLSDVSTDRAVVDRYLDDDYVRDAAAILVGHGHYDHLMDVPYIATKAAHATIYGNRTVKHMLAAFAPDLGPSCDPREIDTPVVDRDRVVAIDDNDDNRLDTRMCDGDTACGPRVDHAGEWIDVAGANVRIRGLCSSHPDQFLGIHFGQGCVEEDLCEPPEKADDWLEGSTMGFLIDFVDPSTGRIRFRIFYQDAPADPPIGFPHPDILAEKRVDLAVVNVGNWDAVDDHPTAILAHIAPRYAIASHWESFFHTQDEPIESLPFQPDPAEFEALMAAAMPPGGESPMKVDGTDRGDIRHWLPMPGTNVVFSPE